MAEIVPSYYKVNRSKVLLFDVSSFEEAFKAVPGGGLQLISSVSIGEKSDTYLSCTQKVNYSDSGKDKFGRLQIVTPSCIFFEYVAEEKPYGIFSTDGLNVDDKFEFIKWSDSHQFIIDDVVKKVQEALLTHHNEAMRACKVVGIVTRNRKAIKFRFDKGTIQVKEKLERLNALVSGNSVVEISSYWALFDAERMTFTIGPNYVLMTEPYMAVKAKKPAKMPRREALRLAKGLPASDEVEEDTEEVVFKKAKVDA